MTPSENEDLLLELLRQCLRTIQSVEHSRREARTIEWQSSPATRAEGQHQGTALHTDPTGLTATDERRLAVRDALRAAESDILLARNHLLATRGRLEKAISAWRG